MTMYKVGDPYTFHHIKPNKDGSINLGSSTSSNLFVFGSYVNSELVDTTYVAVGSNYYPGSAGMSLDGFKDLSCQFGLDSSASGSCVFTVEGTNDDAASPDWINITPACYRVDNHTTGNSSFVFHSAQVGSGIIDYDNMNLRLIRFKVEVLGSVADAVQLHIRYKGL